MIDADRQVDAGGQDDQRLRGAENADDGDLLQDQRQRVGRKESPADGDAEDDDRQNQHDQRHRGRCRMQEMLDALERPICARRKRRRLCRCSREPSRIPEPEPCFLPVGFSGALMPVHAFPVCCRDCSRLQRSIVHPKRPGIKPPADRVIFCRSDQHQPQHLARPSLVSIDFDASGRLVGDEVDAGVEEVLAFGRLRLGRRPWRRRRSPRCRSPPSAADIAARSRR